MSYTNFIYILSEFYPVRSFDCRWKNNLVMLLHKRNICFYTWKLKFVLFLSHFLVNISTAIDKAVSILLSQCWSNADVVSMWFLSMWFQRCFVHVETTSINIRRLNFHLQPNFNVERTVAHRRWIDVVQSKFFQRCLANVETTLINVRRLNFHFQPNINVKTTLIKIDDQRCFNVDSTLMYLL